MKTQTCAYLQISSVPEIVRLYHRTLFILRTEGVGPVAMQIVRKLLRLPQPKAPVVPLENEVLGLQPGEMAEVRSEEEIRRTLDANDKTKGLLFMAEMWKYCGRRFPVYKRVNVVLVESTGTERRLKNTVLLEGVHCDGTEHARCDSSCFHFWREAWLKRVSN